MDILDKEISPKDSTIISQMCSDLDVSLFEALSEEGKQLIEYWVKKKPELSEKLCPGKHLYFLLRNYLIRPQNDFPEFILGGDFLVKLEGIEKTIYIFGEKHIDIPDEAACPGTSSRITPFLENIFKTTHKPIDFFFEATPSDRYTEGIFGKLTENELKLKEDDLSQDIKVLRDTFKDCISNKKNCIYDGVRIHYGDVRFLDTFPSLSHDLTDESQFSTVVKIAKRNIEVELPLLKEGKFFRKIYKQIKNIQGYPEVRKTLITYVSKVVVDLQKTFFNPIGALETESLSHFNREYDKFVLILKKDIDIPIELLQYENLYEKFLSVNSLIIYANSNKEFLTNKPAVRNSSIICLEESLDFFETFTVNFLDAYTLSRMFRKFESYGRAVIPSGVGGTNVSGVEPRNIIFYGGSFHSKNMTSILESTGQFKITRFPVECLDGNYPCCIDISSLKNGLF